MTKPMTKAEFRAAQRAAFDAALAANPGVGPRELARITSIPYTTVYDWLASVRAAERQSEITVPELPSEDLPIEKLIEQRREVFLLKQRAARARALIPVTVAIDGPIGITWFGDPHLDDDGCNWTQLERDIASVKSVRGMYAGNIGDTNNNWIGRLARLWEHQSTSGSQAWGLVEWFVNQMPWLVFLGGNHGAWSGSGDPLRWLLQNMPVMTDDFEARFELAFPSGVRSRVFARHDFPGHSQWNVTHGMAKAATLSGYGDTLLVAGHKHTSGYQIVMNPNTGVISHLVRAAGYKAIDKYAHDGFFTNHTFAESVVTIFNPAYQPTDKRHLKVELDVEEGARRLEWLRNQKGARS